MASWDEASRCPKCTSQGKGVSQHDTERENGEKVKVHVLECPNPLCIWAGERFMVQVNKDGSIPDPESPITRHLNKTYKVDESPAVINQRIAKMNDAAAAIDLEALRQGGMK
jgi:hypothetical protein